MEATFDAEWEAWKQDFMKRKGSEENVCSDQERKETAR